MHGMRATKMRYVSWSSTAWAIFAGEGMRVNGLTILFDASVRSIGPALPIVGYCFGIRSELRLREEVDLNPVNAGSFAQRLA